MRGKKQNLERGQFQNFPFNYSIKIFEFSNRFDFVYQLLSYSSM